MAIHVALNHRTAYRYDRPVSLSPQTVRLRPAPHCRTPVLSYSMRVSPAKHFTNWLQDPHGNYLARLVFPEPTREFIIEVDLVAEIAVTNPFDFFMEEQVEHVPFEYEPTLKKDLAPFLEAAPLTPKLKAFIDGWRRRNMRTIDFLVGLNQALSQQIRYIIRLEPGVQTPEQTLTLGSGSCRDSGWLLVQALRHLGLAARFASGYLIQLTADEKALDGPSGTAVDFTDLHAWAEVYVPGAGWIGLDPTSGLLAGEGHLPLVCTPDPSSAAPVSGTTEECKVEFEHHMSITRIVESPRVTKPYTEEQWQQINALGQHIDRDLVQHDVRLTMGGEPTFVSIDDRDGAEWNTAAVGPLKRKLAGTLIKRLARRYAPGGLLHYGQSKWYPGEPLPRWALGCYWRRDGVPIWNNPALVADDRTDYHHGEPEAKRFITALTHALEIEAEFVIPAYEDVWYYLWKERRLPTNVDPLQSELKNEQERDRLARIFETGLATITGYALPLKRRRDRGKSHWASGPWFFRPEQMFLVPGDSPMGYRLPLDSLPWVAPADYPYFMEPDPAAERAPLPSVWGREIPIQAPQPGPAPVVHQNVSQQTLDPRDSAGPFVTGGAAGASGGGGASGGQAPRDARSNAEPHAHESAQWIIRTALCVEPRHGRLHIFVPPQRNTEDYLDLIAAIENTAAATKLPVIVEGDPPPADPRLNVLKVTPDPGVIEVNLQPASNWCELVEHTTTLYEEARQTRLGTEKFMLDGRHTGTGGGNHVVLGGAMPADSPLLRRPDLLRSLLGYWHNHPSLSFLFSGLFIGPTSQHPRVDEARNDQLHELEIAFSQVKRGDAPTPWLVDRVFRNLLVDVSGNTHRAEFCIDKLFAPDSSGDRQGLLELRGFEMPPHARMSLTQQLLLRALVSRFWHEPYNRTLVRWGTELHDRFMLPHFVVDDFAGVLDDLRASGYDMRPDWFAPHQEFRFPVAGSVAPAGVLMELRQALEPWHVLGEDAAAGATVRYVDSSLERLQVKVNGLIDSRHIVSCNGRRVPLHPTGTSGEYVAGVRFRAWQPPNGLHPTIPVHAPLVFDLVDTWNDRSVGGCTYHVTHPGGRSFETLPVNAYEAEGRRLARFEPFGHTPGTMTAPPEERNPDFPFTLDLRRP